MHIDSGGVDIHVEVTGRRVGRSSSSTGSPTTGRLWRRQVGALSSAGFQVIVPDLRGYGASGKPTGVEEYSLLMVAGDVLADPRPPRGRRAHVVGHDWGAALSWTMASLPPTGSTTWSPCRSATRSRLPGRRLSSSSRSPGTCCFFQFEGIAERWLSDNSWANPRAWSNHPDADAVIAELESNGSLTPGLNWYRANIAPEALVGPPLELPSVQAPVMGVWSSGDFALTEEQMTGSSAYVDGPWRYERLDGPGHWVTLEAPDAVNDLLLDFLPT
jgi:pimeloyl-ACP methyl ester carboxylesterase